MRCAADFERGRVVARGPGGALLGVVAELCERHDEIREYLAGIAREPHESSPRGDRR